MTTGIHSLPQELLHRILTYIGEEDDQTSRIWAQYMLEVTARVCKLWNSHSTVLLYKEIAVDEEDVLILLSETFLLHNPERCNLVETLHFFGFEEGLAAPLICKRLLACNFPAMHSLGLDGRFSQCLSVMTSVPCLAQLKSLSITGKQLPMFNGSSLPALEELSLRDFSEAAARFHPSFPSLQRLTLSKVQGSASVCGWLKAAVTSLNVLRIHVAYMTTGGGVALFSVIPEDVQEVEFRTSRDSDLAALAPYLARYRKLRRLQLSCNSATKILDLVPPHLQILELKYNKVKVHRFTQLLTRLQRSTTLPCLKELAIEVTVFETAPTEELRSACRTAYERLVQRGVSLYALRIERYNIWDMDASVWQQQGSAPPHPLVAFFAPGAQNPFGGMFGHNHENAVTAMLEEGVDVED